MFGKVSTKVFSLLFIATSKANVYLSVILDKITDVSFKSMLGSCALITPLNFTLFALVTAIS